MLKRLIQHFEDELQEIADFIYGEDITDER